MAVFIDSTNYMIQFVGYRADGLQFDQWAPDIYPNNARYINQDHFGDTDYYYVIAFEQGATVPGRVNPASSSIGGGAGSTSGGASITIPDVGGFGVSYGGTIVYSLGLAIVETGPHDLWQVVEDSDPNSENYRKWAFTPGGNYYSSTLSGW